MLNKEEREKDIFYKNLYMQQPCTLLTDENLRNLEIHCEKTIHFGSGRAKEEHSIILELIRKYKDLETEKQKLIEKLEKDANRLIPLAEDGDFVAGRKEEAREILSILKK